MSSAHVHINIHEVYSIGQPTNKKK
jgi:hypothetical protein